MKSAKAARLSSDVAGSSTTPIRRVQGSSSTTTTGSFDGIERMYPATSRLHGDRQVLPTPRRLFGLLHLEAGRLDDRHPARQFIGDHARRFLRPGIEDRLEARLDQGILHLVFGQ